MLNNTTALAFDHLAIVAPCVEAGVAHVREHIGVDVPVGGEHPLMGTKNHLMSLGEACFLEIIAIDPAALAPARPRWFDLDRRGDVPARLEHWLVGTPDLDATIAEAGALAGKTLKQTRGDLTWHLSVRPDGALPLGGAFPSFLQWPRGPHPAHRMADLGCRLVELEIRHPEAERISNFLAGRLSDKRVVIVAGADVTLRASIKTPAGLRELR